MKKQETEKYIICSVCKSPLNHMDESFQVEHVKKCGKKMKHKKLKLSPEAGAIVKAVDKPKETKPMTKHRDPIEHAKDLSDKEDRRLARIKSKHTPGPWHVHIGKAWNEIDVVDSNNNFVACCVGEVGTRMDEPNARLIAAAPDLLEALVKANEFIKAVKRSGVFEGTSNDGHGIDWDIQFTVKDAIAKAKGE